MPQNSLTTWWFLMVIYYGRIRKTINKQTKNWRFLLFSARNHPSASCPFHHHVWLPWKSFLAKLSYNSQTWIVHAFFGGIPLLLNHHLGWPSRRAVVAMIRHLASLAFTAIKATCRNDKWRHPGAVTHTHTIHIRHKSVETKFFRFVGHSSVRWPKL